MAAWGIKKYCHTHTPGLLQFKIFSLDVSTQICVFKEFRGCILISEHSTHAGIFQQYLDVIIAVSIVTVVWFS